jgi:hypothetical protein
MQKSHLIVVFIAATLLAACGGGSASGAAGGDSGGGTTTSSDTTPPTVGTAISFSGISDTTVTVSWGAASDAVTATANLQYRLVRATSSAAIDTIAEVDAAGGGVTVIDDYTAALTSRNVTGLTASTTYFFAVVVRDAAGNKALYTPQSATTAAPGTTASPVFNPAPGTFGTAQNLTMTSATSGAIICYTSDGSTPACNPGKTNCTTGTLYSTAVVVSSTATYKAIACKSGNTDSSVTSGLYTIDPPIVTGTTPADGATGFDPFTGTVTITFSKTMDRSSASFNAADGACTGNIQVSADNFTNCIGVSIPAGNAGFFILTPAAPLLSATIYKVKVLNTLTDTSANAVSPFEHTTGIKTRYYRTEAIDGTNNFVAGETFATAQGANGDIYVTADKDYLYVAMRHGDILAGGSGNKFAYFLFATDLNDAQGLNTSSDGKAKFGTSSKMRWHWKTRVDGTNYTEFKQANGTDWSTDWSANKNDWRAAGYIEARILLTEFGGTAPSTIKVAAYLIDYNGDSGNGWLYNLLSGATEGSGATARDLVKYIDFNRTLSAVPNATATANF